MLEHPTEGTFLVDTGIAAELASHPERFLSCPLEQAAGLDKLYVRESTDQIVGALPKLSGVLLTHLHFDHISGLPAIPRQTPIYLGKGEVEAVDWMHIASRGSIDRLIGDRPPLRAIALPGPDQALDFFGDGSLYLLGSPGHTPGSLALLARTTTGPVLITGDTCHTAFGWEHHVESGSFTLDPKRQAESLERLAEIAKRHPTTRVWLGHQRLKQESGSI